MKTKINDRKIPGDVERTTAEENYLRACEDEDLSFYDLKLIKEQLLESKKSAESKVKKTVICIPQLTVSYVAGLIQTSY